MHISTIIATTRESRMSLAYDVSIVK